MSATGTVRIAVVGQSGNLVSYQDLDLSQYTTVGDLVNAINGISGLSASIDASGHLSIAATTAGDGVAINEMTSSVGSMAARVLGLFRPQRSGHRQRRLGLRRPQRSSRRRRRAPDLDAGFLGNAHRGKPGAVARLGDRGQCAQQAR